jgi:hypothetical protein
VRGTDEPGQREAVERMAGVSPGGTVMLPRPRREPETRPPPFQRRRRKRLAVLRALARGLAWALMTAYGVLTRFAVAVGALWGLLYFGLASSPAREALTQQVSEALPGTLTVGGLRWGPMPWRVAVADVELRGLEGEQVTKVDGLGVTLGLGQTLVSLLAFPDETSETPLTLHVARADVLRPDVAVVGSADGGLGLVRALVKPQSGERKGEGRRGFALEVEEAHVTEGKARVEVGAVRLAAAGISGVTELRVDPSEGLVFSPDLVTVDAFSIFLDPLADRGATVRLHAHRVAVEGFNWRRDRFDWQRVTARLGQVTDPEGWLDAAGGLELGREPLGWWAAAEVAIEGASDPRESAVARLTQGRVRARGHATIQGQGTLEALEASWQVAMTEVEVAGIALDGVTGSGRFVPRPDPVDSGVHALLVDRATVAVAGGTVALGAASWEPGGVPGLRSTRAAAVTWEAEALALERLGALWPGGTLAGGPGGALSGAGTIQLAGRPEGGGDLAVDVRTARVDVRLDEMSALSGQAEPPLAGSGTESRASAEPRESEARASVSARAGPEVLTDETSENVDRPGQREELSEGAVSSPDGMSENAGTSAAPTLAAAPDRGSPPPSVLPPELRRLAEGRYGVTGIARHTWGPPRSGDVAPVSQLTLGGLQVDRLDAAPGSVERDRGLRVRVAGAVDLVDGTLALEPYLRVGELRALPLPSGPDALRGRLVLKDARLTGTLASPRLEGTLNWTGAAVGETALSQVRGRLAYADGWLAVDDLRSTNGLGELALSGRVQVFGPGSDAWPFEVTRAELRRLAVGRFLPALGEEARLDFATDGLSGTLSGMKDTLRGDARLALTDPRLGLERFAHVSGMVRLGREAIALEEGSVTLADGGGTWSGSLRLTRPDGTLSGHVRLGPTDLARVRSLGAAQARGRLEADLALSGTLSEPRVRGLVALRELALGGRDLGSGQLELAPHEDGGVGFSTRSGGFFEGLSSLTGRVALAGLRPVSVQARAALARLDPATLLGPGPGEATSAGFGPARALRMRLTASASVDVDITRGAIAYSVEAPVGGLGLAAPERGKAWENRTTLLLTGTERGLALDPLDLGLVEDPQAASAPAGPRATTAPVSLCGRAALSGAEGLGRVELRIAGRVDPALIPGLDEVVSRSEGGFAIVATAPGQPAWPDEATPVTAENAVGDRGTCFGDPRAALEVSGPLRALAIRGTLAPRGVTFVPRGSGQAVRLGDGARIELRKSSMSEMATITVPQTAPLRAELDDGAVIVHGGVSFRGLQPATADLSLLATDVVARGPGAFELTASADGRVEARDLDGERPDVRISGRVDISEGRFFKSFDVISEALGGAFSRRGDVYAGSGGEGLPWLAAARLDVEVGAQDLLITSALPLARTNLPARLDLSIRGTVGQPELFRRVDLTPGGQLTYLVFERTFLIVSGAIDFDGPPEKPLIDITGRTSIPYLARASNDTLDEDERVVTVTLRVVGRVPDLKIELYADDGTLDQADIQSLLLTGKPRGDLDRAEESRVVSADLATVLNSVLASPFLRTASVGVGQRGALEYRVGTCLAPNLCFDTTTVAGESETTLRARFSLALGDQLVCEGTLRRSDTTTTTNQQTYQARCRYRLPLR